MSLILWPKHSKPSSQNLRQWCVASHFLCLSQLAAPEDTVKTMAKGQQPSCQDIMQLMFLYTTVTCIFKVYICSKHGISYPHWMFISQISHLEAREVELLQAHTSGIFLKRPADISISFCSDQNWLFFTGNWTNCSILSQTLTFF